MKQFPTSRRRGALVIQVAIDGRRPVILKGRVAWALDCLKDAGRDGCNPLKQPALRWSEYVRRLRRRGVQVETVMETHGGQFPGQHARYVLRSRVRMLPPKKGG